MKCQICTNEVPANAKFCNHCGAKIENLGKTCPECGRSGLPEEALFCPDCGAKLAAANSVFANFTEPVKKPNPVSQPQKPPIPEPKPQPKFASFTEVVNGVSFDMVAVEGGSFMMGSPINEPGRSDDEQQHRVTVDDYYIGKILVTQSLWLAIMGNSNGFFTKLFGGSGGFITNDPNLPIDNVSWDDCLAFIRRLNSLTGKKYSLPTEVQWEYAARGGRKSNGFVYSGSNNIDEVAWYNGNCKERRKSVGQKKGNELGLYDMSGNVLEWCQDSDNSTSYRACRGGSAGDSARYCRVAMRHKENYYYSHGGLGFRLALVL